MMFLYQFQVYSDLVHVSHERIGEIKVVSNLIS